jgi:hypothetical protein
MFDQQRWGQKFIYEIRKSRRRTFVKYMDLIRNNEKMK